MRLNFQYANCVIWKQSESVASEFNSGAFRSRLNNGRKNAATGIASHDQNAAGCGKLLLTGWHPGTDCVTRSVARFSKRWRMITPLLLKSSI